MNFKNLHPYLLCGSFPKRDCWIFLVQNKEIRIEGINKLLSALLPLCNGLMRTSEIVDSFTLKKRGTVSDVLKKLFRLRIVYDRNFIFKHWKRYGENPMPFFQNVSDYEILKLKRKQLPMDCTSFSFKVNIYPSFLAELLEKRCSTREFSAIKLQEKYIFGLFQAAYGRQERRLKIWKNSEENTYTVPSGGALFPLVLYLILLRSTENMIRGSYRWDRDVSAFSFLKNQVSLEKIENIVDGIDSFENAVGIMAVFADYERVAKKYSNKAYPLILLEAGHVMQNAYLFSAETNIAFVEILGFNHDSLKKMIRNWRLDPVVVGAFGSI